MSTIKENSTIKVMYKGTLADGTVFEDIPETESFEFTLGEEQVLPDFESGLVGLKAGDKKTITIPADNAYGERMEDLVIELERDQFPDDPPPEVGEQFEIMEKDAEEGDDPILVTIKSLNDTTVTVDANHPLAGEVLTFEVTVKEIIG